ncbi:MAG: type II toxin-antitoxin system PemK/MazF family toxin [Microcoleus sp. PH2017_22_RUC_O_B]|uniref:type II toxin-antitoxin system PemK/MazF family toxin n=1 Tax=unclassified Microcoleus TaxID=2642155 RepID=UPI001D3F89BA|nr:MULTISPECIES: type II toxin-antitoxin system PemK/MazF family toxin [unclassified Microcoleus]MCC3527965.1 type II toxin-antitoxin system PemK/MazF family toxin [Microcoleus sp. PH2017_21_RUC_O_A]MCC3539941.1 type II toxin-antitoxin system PemK/MazF family toxin [Microcoleus sp. PH2017_22_RUC_O_B]
MTNYQSGELVIVAFIFAGAAETKRRPGLVLLDTGDEDMIVAKITSRIPRTTFDVEIQEWQQAGLKRPSVVRLHKLNTLQKSLVERRLGILTLDDLAQVRNRVKQIWSFL